MSRRRGHESPSRDAAVGITGVVILLVVAWVSYGALQGLPGQQRYRITADVPSATRLHVTDEVRIAGTRVGQVEEISAQPGPRPSSRLRLALDPDVGALPADTTIAVRPASVLGATYVDLVPGTGTATIPEGGRLVFRWTNTPRSAPC